ncbi:MAG: polysaccharide biosynthesis protein [Lachnospiraceae bacterium]|jgi:stage V sporulation protein B|nr:polysaccharide biosynthesis protein [Lachnospiraceae bacterium]
MSSSKKTHSRVRHPLVMGAAILTVTGLVTRIIGFFYRIYLSRLFGEEGMGIYQLLSPVLALSFSLTAAGFQTAISKFVAAQAGLENTALPSRRPMIMGLLLTVPLSLTCTAGLFVGSDYIAVRLLLEPRTAPMIRILAPSIPLSAIHACVNGYFYGIKKAGVPAGTQLLEQCCRVACVYLVSAAILAQGRIPSINVAVLGLTIGEGCSMLAALLAAWIHFSRYASAAGNGTLFPRSLDAPGYGQLLGMVLPLTANRIVLNLLQSVESVSIPAGLRSYGYDNATALSVYGVLTGMAFPMIFFPNALTGSVSVMLLPMISECYARGDDQGIRRAVLRTVKYCFLLGLACMGFFLLTGRLLGEGLYRSPLAGHFIRTLSLICPFLYLDTTLSSVLQGLGLAGRLFLINVTSLLVRLLFILLTVPRLGIQGYLYGLLASQILQCVLYLGCLWRQSLRGKKRN